MKNKTLKHRLIHDHDIPEGTDWLDFIPAEYKKQFADIELKTGEKYFNVYPNGGMFIVPLTEHSSRYVKYADIKRVRWISWEEHMNTVRK